MCCEENRPLLFAYADDVLEETLSTQVATHVETCAICQAALAAIHAGDTAIRAALWTEVSPDLSQRLLAEVGPAATDIRAGYVRQVRLELLRRLGLLALAACLTVIALLPRDPLGLWAALSTWGLSALSAVLSPALITRLQDLSAGLSDVWTWVLLAAAFGVGIEAMRRFRTELAPALPADRAGST